MCLGQYSASYPSSLLLVRYKEGFMLVSILKLRGVEELLKEVVVLTQFPGFSYLYSQTGV